MRYLCMTVTEASPQGGRNLDRLVDSLQRQDGEVDLVLVVRGGARQPVRRQRGRVTVHPLLASHVVGLSVARNLAQEHARRLGLLERVAVVSFPDDDCRYPDGLLSRVAGHLARSGCECVTGAYGPSIEEVDRRRFRLGDASLTPRLVMRAGCSGSMFFTGRAVRAIGDFDVRLGLGAPYGASEDADYLLRALALGLPAVYRPRDVVVLHPYKVHRPAEYYVGNVAVLAKHAGHLAGIRLLLARRLLHGMLLVTRSNMAFAHLRRALDASCVMGLDRYRQNPRCNSIAAQERAACR